MAVIFYRLVDLYFLEFYIEIRGNEESQFVLHFRRIEDQSRKCFFIIIIVDEDDINHSRFLI